jgi:hypothetical protein
MRLTTGSSQKQDQPCPLNRGRGLHSISALGYAISENSEVIFARAGEGDQIVLLFVAVHGSERRV